VWVCPNCTDSGITIAEVQAQAELRERAKQAAKDKAVAPLSRTEQQALDKARTLHGRLIRKTFRDPATRKAREYIGRLEYLGQSGPACHRYVVRYTDGDSETLESHQIKPAMLLPADAETPPELTAASALTANGEDSNASRSRVEELLQRLMPGPWTAGHITRLSNSLPGGSHSASADGSPECVVTLPQEVQVLTQFVHVDRLGTVFDPWSGTGTIASVLQQSKVKVLTNDINTQHPAAFHLDALEPRLYEVMQRVHQVQSVVSSPWFRMLDLAAPLALNGSLLCACLHVPGHFLTDAHPIRHAWLKQLHSEGRLAIISGLPLGPLGRRCLWLILFAKAAHRSLILKSAAADQSFLFV
jgi:hypothetical protein